MCSRWIFHWFKLWCENIAKINILSVLKNIPCFRHIFYFFLLIVDYIKFSFSLSLGILCGHFELWWPVFLYVFQYHYSWQCSFPSVLWGISADSSTWLFPPVNSVISVNSTRDGSLSSGSLKDYYIWILETQECYLVYY